MSVSYFGDYDTTETVKIPFNTFTSDDPSASATITNLVAGDIEIHKDAGLVQRASDAGVTIVIDFDSITGNHIASIDLSDNTDAGFYAAGSRYQVRIEGTTVDAGTINAWIGAFSIGCMLRPTTAGRTLDIQATGEVDANLTMMGGVAQSATDLKDFADAGYDPATNKVQGVVLTDTCTTLTGHTAQTADHTAGIADIPTVAEFNARTLASADYVVTTDTIAGVTLVTTCTTNTDMTGTNSAALASVCTEGRLAELDAANIPTDLTNIEADTQDVQTQVGTAGVGLTNINLPNQTMDITGNLSGSVGSLTGHTVQTADHTADITAIKTVTDALTAAAATKLALSIGTMQAGTVSHDNTAASTTVFYSDDITEATADHYNGRIVLFTSGVLQYQATDITDYVFDTGEGKFTVTALTEAPADNVTFIIV